MVGYETGMWSLTEEGEKSGKTVILVLLVKGLIRGDHTRGLNCIFSRYKL